MMLIMLCHAIYIMDSGELHQPACGCNVTLHPRQHSIIRSLYLLVSCWTTTKVMHRTGNWDSIAGVSPSKAPMSKDLPYSTLQPHKPVTGVSTAEVSPSKAPMSEDLPEPTLPTTHTSSPGPTVMLTSRSHQVASGAPSGLALLPFLTWPDEASLEAFTGLTASGKLSSDTALPLLLYRGSA